MQLLGLGSHFPNPIPSVPWINLIYELLPHRAVQTEKVLWKARSTMLSMELLFLYHRVLHMHMNVFAL